MTKEITEASEQLTTLVSDIDSVNMRAHIRDAKGNKDRLVPLPEKTLHVLRYFPRDFAEHAVTAFSTRAVKS